MQVQKYFVEIRLEMTVELNSIKIQIEMIETKVEMTV